MKKIWKLFLIGFVFTCASIFIHQHKHFRVENIIPLELAQNASTMQQCVSEINHQNLSSAFHQLYLNTLWDFVFIIAYSLLSWFSLRIIADAFGITISRSIYLLLLVTGLLDVVENYFLLATGSSMEIHFSLVYYWAVRIKWGFAILNSLLILTVLLYAVFILFDSIKISQSLKSQKHK